MVPAQKKSQFYKKSNADINLGNSHGSFSHSCLIKASGGSEYCRLTLIIDDDANVTMMKREKFWGLLLSCTPGLPHTVPCCTDRDHDGGEEEKEEKEKNKDEKKKEEEEKEEEEDGDDGDVDHPLSASCPVHNGRK